MFSRKSNPERQGVPAVKLTRTEKKQLAAIAARVHKEEKIAHSAQQTIPYLRMCQDGICQVDENHYNKSIQYYDINYRLAQDDDQRAILNAWGDLLNYFDYNVSIQFNFHGLTIKDDVFEKYISIPDQDTDTAEFADEFSSMLQNQLEKGNNSIGRTKYITFTVAADNLRAAKLRLERIESDILNLLRRMSVTAEPLIGKQRLQMLHDIFHIHSTDRFNFEWRWLPPSGLSTKDFIAPAAFDFHERNIFRMGETLGQVAYLQFFAPQLDDELLAKILEVDANQLVSIHVQPVNHAEAMKMVKRKLTDLDRTKIEEQMKAVRSGYDMEILPPDLVNSSKDVLNLLTSLQSRNEHLFLVTFLVMMTGTTKQQLKNALLQIQGLTNPSNCPPVLLDYQQEDGMVSCLPLGVNRIQVQRTMTTSSTAILVPFTTRELFLPGGDALYYGLNAVSNNAILIDRKQGKNSNGLIFGTPGSGKSFYAKREIECVRFMTNDDIMISDPESEYHSLTNALGGQVIILSPGTTQYVNPMDISADYGDESDPVKFKSDFLLSIFEIILNVSSTGIDPGDKSIIDHAIRCVYQRYFADPCPENMPILGDLYEEIKKSKQPRAEYIATALDLYVSGSLNIFNHRTNVQLNKRIVCFDIKQLGKQLKRLGMLIVQDQIWNRVTQNRSAGKSTWYYADEFHLLLADPQSSAFSVEIWKRFRKFGGVPTGITQNVMDLLKSPDVATIFSNSDFICMLNQGHEEREILAQKLNISNHQLSYVTSAIEGQGLLYFGGVLIPFVDRFPKDSKMYQIMTTRLSEVKREDDAE